MNSKIPSLSVANPNYDKNKEEEKQSDLEGTTQVQNQNSLDDDLEGQHNDQDEENALAPKRANKQLQPP